MNSRLFALLPAEQFKLKISYFERPCLPSGLCVGLCEFFTITMFEQAHLGISSCVCS